MNDYLKRLAEMGIDPEKALDLLEKRLLETNGRIHGFNANSNVRCLRLENDKKLVNYSEGFHFESGLKNLTKDIKNGGIRNDRQRHYLGQSKPNSTIDEWLLLGNTIDIKPEEDKNSFTIGAGNHNFKGKNLFEVNAKKLIDALEWFDLEMPELKDLIQMSKLRILYNNENDYKRLMTIQHCVQDDNRATVKKISNSSELSK